MGKKINLTEDKLRLIINESVKNVLSEMSMYRKGDPGDGRETKRFSETNPSYTNFNELKPDDANGDVYHRVNVEGGEKVDPSTDKMYYENDIIDKIIWRFKKMFPCREDGMPRASNIMQWVRSQAKRFGIPSWTNLPDDYTVPELYEYLCSIRFPNRRQG